MSVDYNSSFYQYCQDEVFAENISFDDNLHWFLIPAVAVIALLSFMEKRKYLKPNLLGGRPALVSPFGFLDEPRNRWGMMFVFGAVTGNFVKVSGKILTNEVSKWAKVFFVYILSLEVSVISYPLFACMTNRHKLIGSITGLLYAMGWFGYDLFCTIQTARCYSQFNDPSVNDDTKGFVIGLEVPILLCNFLVVLKFSWKIYKCFKKGIYSDSDQEQSKLCKSYHLTYVKYLVKRINLHQYDGKRLPLVEKIRNMIMRPVPGFRFPISIMITVFMYAVMLYLVSIVPSVYRLLGGGIF
ncbi:stimulated by retinoic acid gene 6 protein-like [Mercenaria mercenaria]|uniref:stimulated by retinoic acid gene 6 protein-like n=1 Tax=Mercenaria mercenaria TaxID=6596 RepID=UPI00234F4BC7|nr:stimulated by retinoic acid gene 6 protein-like [Mercenaria mercenaria]